MTIYLTLVVKEHHVLPWVVFVAVTHAMNSCNPFSLTCNPSEPKYERW